MEFRLLKEKMKISKRRGSVILELDTVKIGKRIKERRLILKMTQEDFGNKVGLSPVYVSSIENGHKVPKFKTFIRILNVLQINADSVLMDVTDTGLRDRQSELSSKLANLRPEEKKCLINIMEKMIDEIVKMR